MGLVALVGHGTTPGPVWAQDTPAKTKSDGAAKKDAPPVAERAETVEEPAQVTAEALSYRYRFIEKYGLTEEPARPELITQYRVGIRETQKTEREKPQGAPDRAEITRQTIYTERAAQVGKLGEMNSAVRRYDRFQIKDLAVFRPANPPLFEGLTIWLRRQSGKKPQILSLTNGRPLREFEFNEIAKQVIVPQLASLFPPTPRRVGDTWSITRTAAQSLVGEVPEVDDYELTGTLVEVRKAATGPSLTAIIGLSGQMNLSLGLSALKAQLHFVFDPLVIVSPGGGKPSSSKAADDGQGKKREQVDAGVVDARGRIARVLMLWAVTDVLPEGEGRLKQTVTYELNLERRFKAPNEPASGQNAPLPVPEPPPAPDQANSWLVYEDPQERFHFLHPQGLVLSPRMSDQHSLEFVDQNPGVGQDVFILRFAPGSVDPQADSKFRDAQQFQREIDADWAKSKQEILRGTSEWLPAADWAPWKVYRKELGVKTANADEGGKGVQRIFIDNYLVLSNRNECFHATSMTVRNDHVAFRTQAESIIKSFRFGPWDGKSKPPVATPALPPTPPR
jgi:hypothetical protein